MPKRAHTTKPAQLASLTASRLGFVFLGIYAVSILIYQAWRLIPADMLQNRWILLFAALGVNITLWYFSHFRKLATLYYQGIIFLQVCMYLAIATFTIYAERGMASSGVILYVIPLVIVALTKNVKALFGCAAICSFAYASAAITYFNEFPSEGYKVELWGSIVFYSLILFLLSTFLWLNVRNRPIR